ncbi:DsbA family protein [Methylopila sp. Yamaguchi]|uniref:DsbA family protein n=1 Tax=Methylopila sp. Yamaguchi TaxID=1437817 RepID=UPI000CAF6C66|nr:DsbA family protein [Methylopila sp. Yamaguchi]GBD49455.1 DSBA oxidoreductase [Methylopila sp. Yamaguchi]
MPRSFRSIALAGAALAALASLALVDLPFETATAQTATTTLDKPAIEKIVRDYIVNNPEILIEAQKELTKRQEAAQAAAARQKLAEKPATLENSKLQAVLGNPNGDVTLVEFFDYNCGYCKRALGDVNELIEADPKLKVVLKEFPILGRGSAEAAQVSAAVNVIAPAKYRAFHDKLLAAQGQVDGAAAIQAAKDVGVDQAALKKAFSHPDVKATIEESYDLANQFGVESTPTFILADAILPGAVGVDALKKRIAAVRECGKATC